MDTLNFIVGLLDDRILIEPDEKSERSKHGLHIPETSQKEMHQGTIIAVGEGLAHPQAEKMVSILNNMLLLAAPDKSSTMNSYADQIRSIITGGNMKVAVDMRVIYGKFSGTELEIDDKKYVIMRQDDVKLIMKQKTSNDE